MTTFRNAIPDFQLANPIYVGATVTFYEADENGQKTSTLAALYANPTGPEVAQNPQELDSTGKFSRPVYHAVPLIAEVTGATVGSHTTGVIHSRGTWRGDYATATRYYVNDQVRYGGAGSKKDNLYLASQDFTSDASSIDTDIGAGKLVLVVDVETVNTQTAVAVAAKTDAETARTGAEAAQTAAEAVLTDPDFVAVVGIQSQIVIVSGIDTEVSTVAGVASDVTTVANDSADIQTLAANIATIASKANADLSNVPSGSVTLAQLASGIYASEAEAKAGTENTKLLTSLRVAQAIAERTPLPSGYLNGLVLSNNVSDVEHDIDIAIGVAAAVSGERLNLASGITKRIDAAWAVGTGNGGLFSGTVAANTWYAVHLVRKTSDGSIDAGFDTSATAANIPSGYSSYRRIGWVRTDGAANIRKFIQAGDLFVWDSMVADYTGTNISNAGVDFTVSAPPGSSALICVNNTTNGAGAAIFHSKLVNQTYDVAVNANFRRSESGGREVRDIGPIQLPSNSSLIRGQSDSTWPISIAVRWWIDIRGR